MNTFNNRYNKFSRPSSRPNRYYNSKPFNRNRNNRYNKFSRPSSRPNRYYNNSFKYKFAPRY